MRSHLKKKTPTRFRFLLALVFLLLSLAGCGQHVKSGFVDFLEKVQALPIAERQALVEDYISGHNQSPLFENDTTAILVFQGTAQQVAFAGDATHWRPVPMNFIEGADLWYHIGHYQSTARLDYKFIIDDKDWILDPQNPRRTPGGFGDNSELAMPEYIQPSEIVSRQDVSKGSLNEIIIPSVNLGQDRHVLIYLPPDYNQSFTDYPLAVFTDGNDFINLGSVQVVLDNLLQDRKIRPLVAVFENPQNRMLEYGGAMSQNYELFITTELLPFIESRYKISPQPSDRVIVGASLGALVATQIVYNNPKLFGQCIAFSPAYWYNDHRVFDQIVNGERRDIQFYLDWGMYESGAIKYAAEMRDFLLKNGYSIRWKMWHEGHSWGSWRAHLDEALEFCFPPR